MNASKLDENPLYHTSPCPDFDRIVPDHVEPAFHALLALTRQKVQQLEKVTDPTWENFAELLMLQIDVINRSWGVVSHLHSVQDTPEWRAAYQLMQPEMSRFFAELGQNEILYAQYKAIRDQPRFAALTAAQQRAIHNECRDFRLSGAELSGADKQRFQVIQEELAHLASRFSENLLDATNAYGQRVDNDAELAGIPADVIAAARAAATAKGEAGAHFSLQAPFYLPVMQYADHRPLRQQMYRAYATRAAEFTDCGSKAEWDNTPIIKKMLALKKERARLLGFVHHAEFALATKMADSATTVLEFLHDLLRRAKPYAEKDKAELSQFAAESLAIPQLEQWDVAYASEKLRQARYDYSELDVKNYFTEPQVLAGLFGLIQRLFGLKVVPATAAVWHDSVRFFQLKSANGDVVGAFYLDVYARPSKQGGAWMNDLCGRCMIDGKIRTPVALICCNFPAPLSADQPATWSHDDVLTLLHEMGHTLHHLLTKVDIVAVSGLNGVEWDAVELPSQFMEHYGWQYEVIKTFTAHVDTQACLPEALFNRMLSARHFQSGLMMVRQLEYALFDVLVHSEFDPEQREVLELLEEIRQQVAVLSPPPWQRFANSFGHIFGGGYSAGYYSYKWAEVLSSDVFAAFEELGDPFDQTLGQRLLDEILSRGGERDTMSNFIAFRGRQPTIDALMRHSGMA